MAEHPQSPQPSKSPTRLQSPDSTQLEHFDVPAVYVHNVTRGYVVTKEYAVKAGEDGSERCVGARTGRVRWPARMRTGDPGADRTSTALRTSSSGCVVPQRVARPFHSRVPLQRHIIPEAGGEVAGSSSGSSAGSRASSRAGILTDRNIVIDGGETSAAEEKHADGLQHDLRQQEGPSQDGGQQQRQQGGPQLRPQSARGCLDTTTWADPLNTGDAVAVPASDDSTPVPPWMVVPVRVPSEADERAVASAARRRPRTAVAAQGASLASSIVRPHTAAVLGVQQRAAQRDAARARDLASREARPGNATSIAPEDSMMMRAPTPPRGSVPLDGTLAGKTAEMLRGITSAQAAVLAAAAAVASKGSESAPWRHTRRRWRSKHEEASYHKHVLRRSQQDDLDGRQRPMSAAQASAARAYATAKRPSTAGNTGGAASSRALDRWEQQRRHHLKAQEALWATTTPAGPLAAGAPAMSSRLRSRRASATRSRPSSAWPQSVAGAPTSTGASTRRPRHVARPASAVQPGSQRHMSALSPRPATVHFHASAAPRMTTLTEVSDGVGGVLKMLRPQ